MNRRLKYKLLFIALVTVLSLVMLYRYQLNLGLDLRGGMHLVLQVETQDVIDEELNQMRERLVTDLRNRQAGFSEIRVSAEGIEILGVDPESRLVVEEVLDPLAPAWTYRSRAREGRADYFLQMAVAYRRQLAEQAVRQAREIIAQRVDQFGVAEPTITIYGGGEVQDQIIVELPGIEDFERVKDLIRSTARLELKLTHPDPAKRGPFPSREAALAAFDHNLPDEYEILPYLDRRVAGGQTQYMVVRKAASLTGQHLKNARRSIDQLTGRSEVVFFLNSEGVRLFGETTAANVNNQLAIVLDGVIRSAPNINERIDTESARITGSFTPEEAEDLALVLRSGALPADLRVLEERTVGPSLGRDSVVRGVYASVLGLLLVLGGMLFFYRGSGINAVVCLLLNLVILLGVLAYFRATLTLPGIAGIILTIGMAVDANILIFERIKEELRAGKGPRAAVEAGFGKVFSTIMDTNVTTLIAALFLFQFGTGPIRGFAVTLAIGLIANLFTATFVSRALFDFRLQRREVTALSI